MPVNVILHPIHERLSTDVQPSKKNETLGKYFILVTKCLNKYALCTPVSHLPKGPKSNPRLKHFTGTCKKPTNNVCS